MSHTKVRRNRVVAALAACANDGATALDTVPDFAASRSATTQLRTLQGSFLSVSDATLTDPLGGNANIIVTDIGARNEIMHAIDVVVLPFAP